MEEEAKAVQEVAIATGKAIDAARDAGGFIAKFIAGPLEQGMGIFEDRLRYTRWERQVRLMTRAHDFLHQAGLTAPTRALPLKLAIPLLQGATLEDDDSLQDRWAQLLVNASNADAGLTVHRSFLSILEELSPLEAQILDTLYAIPFAENRTAALITNDLPNSTRVMSDDENPTEQPSEEIAVALGNLIRLGCALPLSVWDGGESLVAIHRTSLGAAFIRACQVR